MKIVEINSVCGVGSTGRICVGIAEVAAEHGYECKIAYGRMKAPEKYEAVSHRIGSDLGVKLHAIKSRLFGKTGLYSKGATKKFISWLKEYKPDIIHLHNLHGYYINVPMLFDYIKTTDAKVIWTLHDCWAFTGHCAYFDSVGCAKWKTQCEKCPQKSSYPKSFIDFSDKIYAIKKYCFSDVKDMTIVTPSQWLADLVKQSFLRNYSVTVIYNGIDLDVFHPISGDILKRLNCDGKKVVLGVAYQWGERKGLDVFIELSQRLNDDYRIILVGVDEKLLKSLPQSIIGITRTNSQSELAELYSAADVFVNPTREEVLGMVNIEAIACGTPVITFETGGSPETIDEKCGVVVAKNDIDSLEYWIHEICDKNIFSEEACLKRAQQFDYKDKYRQYVEMYSRKNI